MYVLIVKELFLFLTLHFESAMVLSDNIFVLLKSFIYRDKVDVELRCVKNIERKETGTAFQKFNSRHHLEIEVKVRVVVAPAYFMN